MQTLKTDIKQRILQVAHREFINNGVQRTCIRNVAHKAGVTVGNLYHYFDSKDTLFRAVLQPLLTALDRYILSHNNEEFLSLEVFDLQQHQINHVMTMLTLVKQFRPELRLLLFNAEGTSWRGIRIVSPTDERTIPTHKHRYFTVPDSSHQFGVDNPLLRTGGTRGIQRRRSKTSTHTVCQFWYGRLERIDKTIGKLSKIIMICSKHSNV